jgi:hypothetical protein
LREIIFEDDVIWIIRLPFDEIPAKVLQSEVDTMRYVRENTTIPVPEVFAYDCSAENELGWQYMVMEGIYGKVHGYGKVKMLLDIPDDQKEKVCRQLAGYLLQLNKLRFRELGSLSYGVDSGEIEVGDIFRTDCTLRKCTTEAEYYVQVAKQLATGALNYKNPELKKDVCFMAWLRRLIAANLRDSAAIEANSSQFDTGAGYPLAHGDFHARNILFDDNYTIVAIIDWAYSHTVPIDVFASVPGGDYLWPEYYIQKMNPKSSSWMLPLSN